MEIAGKVVHGKKQPLRTRREIKMGEQSAVIESDEGVTVRPKRKKIPMKQVRTGKKIRCPICGEENTELFICGPWWAGKLGLRCDNYNMSIFYGSTIASKKMREQAGISESDFAKVREEYSKLNMPPNAVRRRKNRYKHTGVVAEREKAEKPVEVKKTVDKGLLDALRELL